VPTFGVHDNLAAEPLGFGVVHGAEPDVALDGEKLIPLVGQDLEERSTSGAWSSQHEQHLSRPNLPRDILQDMPRRRLGLPKRPEKPRRDGLKRWGKILAHAVDPDADVLERHRQLLGSAAHGVWSSSPILHHGVVVVAMCLDRLVAVVRRRRSVGHGVSRRLHRPRCRRVG
jgi:hypothetical protein